MNDDLPFDDLAFEEPEPSPPEKSIPPPRPRDRSLADAVVDAIAGVKRSARNPTCSKCGSDQLYVFAPLMGGVATRRCRACKHTVPWASVSSKLVTERPPDGLPGPFAAPPGTEPPSFTPTDPIYRRKARGRPE